MLLPCEGRQALRFSAGIGGATTAKEVERRLERTHMFRILHLSAATGVSTPEQLLQNLPLPAFRHR
jgi:hypothetical protein